MIKYLQRHEKDYSRYKIIKNILQDVETFKDVYILLPFSKNQFIKYFFRRSRIVNDFFISNYDTYVHDRKKIKSSNPRAWWKWSQDWINFRFSKYLVADTESHLKYWESLFGKYNGKSFVMPVLADNAIYYPDDSDKKSQLFTIVFYGSFIPLHGIDKLLKAFRILEEKNILFKAKVIGNGQTFNQMKHLFDELKLKHVEMNGMLVTEKELADEIRLADVVLGVFGDSQKALSVVPNKVYQALACKKAVLSMQSQAIKEFFTDEEVFMCENDPASIAASLEEFVDNKELVEGLAIKGNAAYKKLYASKSKDFISFVKSVDR